MFGYGTSKYDEIANEECWARFNITLTVDIFDKCKIFLIENQKNARIIYRYPDVEGKNIIETFLNKGLFDKIFEDAFKAIESLYIKELDK